MSINKICASIKKYNNFLIAAHTNPEGDALGSQLGFYYLVKKLGKQAVIVSDDALPYGFDFLPGINQIRRLNKAAQNIKFDCLVVLDCADLKRTGGVYKLNRLGRPILNIDHHISNQIFGDLNWVNPRASSCSEMIYQLYRRLRVSIDHAAALALYTGIMTDTGSFRYTNTSSETFKAAGALLELGIKPAEVYRYTYENIPAAEVKLLLKILAQVKFFGQGKIACFEINPKATAGKKPLIDLADQCLNFGRAIKGVEVVALFKYNLGLAIETRVNLRSQGKIDVNQVAAYFGGGGHKTAAGCTISGKLANVRKKVIARICRELK